MVSWLKCTSPGYCNLAWSACPGSCVSVIHNLPPSCRLVGASSPIQSSFMAQWGIESHKLLPMPHSPGWLLPFRSLWAYLTALKSFGCWCNSSLKNPCAMVQFRQCFPRMTLAMMPQDECPVFPYKKQTALVSLRRLSQSGFEGVVSPDFFF